MINIINLDGNVYENIIRKNNQQQDYIGYGSKNKVGEGADIKRS